MKLHEFGEGGMTTTTLCSETVTLWRKGVDVRGGIVYMYIYGLYACRNIWTCWMNAVLGVMVELLPHGVYTAHLVLS